MRDHSKALRQEIVTICRRLYERGLIVGTEGNVSARMDAQRLWITPTGCHKGFIKPEELVLLDLEGRVHQGQGRPSSETPMHLALYQHRPEVGAVVHAHPPFATALTVAGYPLTTALLPEAVVGLGEVPTVPYHMPSTAQFAQEVVRIMGQAPAALLEHHGGVAAGQTLQIAFNMMETLERVAQVFYLAKTLGQVRSLPSQAVAALRALRPA